MTNPTAASEQTCVCADGTELSANFFQAETPWAQVIIAPAMGVPRSFYTRFAAYLAAAGINALTFDYRCHSGARMADWGRQDIEAAIGLCDTDTPIFLLGHSCGGQLPGLAPSCDRLAGFIFVAATSGYWKHWHGGGRLGMWMLGHALIPLLARGSHFPARKLRLFSLNVPASVVRDWGRWVRSPRYLFDTRHGLDTSRYPKLAKPALTYSFYDDGFAPPEAINALLTEYPALRIDRRHVDKQQAEGAAIGHMGFFKPAMQATLWQPTISWLKEQTHGE